MERPTGLIVTNHKFSKRDNIVISCHAPLSINHWYPFLVPQRTWMVTGPNASAGSIRHTKCLLHTDSQIEDRYSVMKTCIFTDSQIEIDTQQILLMNKRYQGMQFIYPKVKGVIFDPIYRVKAIWSQHMREAGRGILPLHCWS